MTPISRSGDTFEFKLTNVGSRADQYSVTAEGPGDVDVTSLTLASGAEDTLRVVIDAGATPDTVSIVVRSLGRDGAEVVRLPANWAG
ncbi:MAG: hypothetical protein CMJ44_07390 [Pimelobacter sp.]|nr:hypothetical protein [Pimelobacter sp.]